MTGEKKKHRDESYLLVSSTYLRFAFYKRARRENYRSLLTLADPENVFPSKFSISSLSVHVYHLNTSGFSNI